MYIVDPRVYKVFLQGMAFVDRRLKNEYIGDTRILHRLTVAEAMRAF